MKLLTLCAFFVLTAFLLSGCLVNKDPVSASNDETNSPYLRMNEVKGRIIRHFHKNFPSVENERWLHDESSRYVAIFRENKIPERVIYDRFGYFICLVRIYGPTDLNEDLKSHIHAIYKDSKIIAVTEVSDLVNQGFYVKIQISEAIKTVYCQDGRLEETESIPYEASS
jgi:hypothetical protein